MKQGIYTVLSNEKIARDIYKMKLKGDTSCVTLPGQFIDIRLEGFYLRRPISVCDWDRESITIIYKTIGGGTEYMSTLREGDTLDILTGLGNGYNTVKSGGFPLLIGGGVGIPPLFALAKRLISEGKQVSVILGFNTQDEIYYKREFEEIGTSVYISTVDGSVGIKGFATDAIKDIGKYTYVYTCGPEAMMRAVYDNTNTSGQYSFEERMGCGYGGCMGCSCKTKYGYKRICKEGPVLEKEEIIW